MSTWIPKVGDKGLTRSGRYRYRVVSVDDDTVPGEPVVVSFKGVDSQTVHFDCRRSDGILHGYPGGDLMPPTRWQATAPVWVVYRSDGEMYCVAKTQSEAERWKPDGGFIQHVPAAKFEVPAA